MIAQSAAQKIQIGIGPVARVDGHGRTAIPRATHRKVPSAERPIQSPTQRFPAPACPSGVALRSMASAWRRAMALALAHSSQAENFISIFEWPGREAPEEWHTSKQHRVAVMMPKYPRRTGTVGAPNFDIPPHPENGTQKGRKIKHQKLALQFSS